MQVPDRSFRETKPEVLGPGSARLEAVQSALIVVAHPDDVEAHCGGTVRLLARAGSAIHLIVCTSGEKGTADRSIVPEELALVRQREQIAAAQTLGITSTTFLGYPDGEVSNSIQLRSEIVRHVRGCRPELVITHDPEFPWPAYTAHRDHRAVGRVTLDALYPDARDHLFFPEQLRDEGLEPHVTPEAWLIMSRVPDLFVNIGSVIDEKIAARLQHVSQHTDATALDRSFRARAADIGQLVGIPMAEALKIVRFV